MRGTPPPMWVLLMSAVVCGVPGCSGCEPQYTPSTPEAEAAAPPDTQPENEGRSAGQPSSDPVERPEVSPDQKKAADDSRPTPDSANGPLGGQSVGATPEEALRSARELKEQARAKAQSGDAAGAFVAAREGWEKVNEFPEHAGCQQLAAELLVDLAASGKRANAAQDATDFDKPLIVK